MAEKEDLDKRYVNSFTIKEMVFEDGNSIMAVDINVAEFIAMLKDVEKNEKGYAKFRIVRRKSVSEWGHTHFMSKYKKRDSDESSDDDDKDSKKGKKSADTKKTTATKKTGGKKKEAQGFEISGGADGVPF